MSLGDVLAQNHEAKREKLKKRFNILQKAITKSIEDGETFYQLLPHELELFHECRTMFYAWSLSERFAIEVQGSEQPQLIFKPLKNR